MASLLETYGWHEWLCHTNFSFLVGASHPHEYIERAAELGYQSLAVTDYDGVYGLARSYRALKNTPNLNMKYGAEIHLELDHALPIPLQNTLVLVAQTHTGYKHLCQILNYTRRGGKHNAHIPVNDLLNFATGDLVAIQPMRGYIRQPHRHNDLIEQTQKLREHFQGRFYQVVSRHLNPAEDYWVPIALHLAKTLQLPLLLSQDVYFHDAQQKDMCDLLQAIRMNLTMDQAIGHMFANQERHLHSLPQIEWLYNKMPGYEQMLKTSRELADSCTFTYKELRYQYPHEMIPNGMTALEFLHQLVIAGCRAVYGDVTPKKIVELVAKEMALIEQLKFADYFLTVWDIVRWAREQNILCQGRGSAANSAVCFVLGITAMNPNEFDALFERFISVERGDPPDIDVDFEHERREEVIQYIYQRYGRERAAMVANVITFRRRGALRAVGKALGVEEKHLENISETLSIRFMRGAPSANLVAEAQKADAAIEEHKQADIDWDLWAALAERLRGFPRHLGIHSGGFIVAQEALSSIVASEPATMEGRTVVQWCKDDIEALGLFKIDVLALGMLTAIRKCIDDVRTYYHKDIPMHKIPQPDAATYAMIQKADTVGTFQIESRAQMTMLPRLKPKNFYDLAIEVAIIRPGPITGGIIHPYLRRRNGEEAVTYPDPRLEPILKRTLGIPIFQEQVMRIAIATGNFTPGEANELRRHMGSWGIKGQLDPWIKRLADGMKSNGIAEPFVKSILGHIKGFSEYGFPESHAASFALIAYASAYFKCWYPAPFFAAILNSQPMGFYSAHVLLQTAQKAGVKVLPVCVRRSQWDTRLEPIEDGVYALRMGMRLVSGLSEKGAQKLLVKRLDLARVETFEDFVRQLPLNRTDLTALAGADAFHSFGTERRQALWAIEAAPLHPIIEDIEANPEWRPLSEFDVVQQDFRSVATSLRAHPVTIIKRDHWCFAKDNKSLTLSSDLHLMGNRSWVSVFGMVMVRQSPPTAKGMVFITLEDEKGFINLVIQPHIYKQFYTTIEKQNFLFVEGVLQSQPNLHSLLVRKVHTPEAMPATVVTMDNKTNKTAVTTTAPEFERARNYM